MKNGLSWAVRGLAALVILVVCLPTISWAQAKAPGIVPTRVGVNRRPWRFQSPGDVDGYWVEPDEGVAANCAC
jgi:hypothetical protein